MIVGVLSKKLVKTPISFYNKKAFFSSLIKLDTELKEGQQMKRRCFCFLLFLLLILTGCRMQAFRPTDLERSTVNLTQGSIEGRIKEETIQTIHEPLTLLFENLTADQIESEFNDILAQEESKTKKGLSLFLFMTKNQIFWDGNKRTAVVTVNKYFYENGLGIFTIPHKEFIEFNELLSRYYHSNVQNNDDAILTFMYERCIFGIDYI